MTSTLALLSLVSCTAWPEAPYPPRNAPRAASLALCQPGVAAIVDGQPFTDVRDAVEATSTEIDLVEVCPGEHPTLGPRLYLAYNNVRIVGLDESATITGPGGLRLSRYDLDAGLHIERVTFVDFTLHYTICTGCYEPRPVSHLELNSLRLHESLLNGSEFCTATVSDVSSVDAPRRGDNPDVLGVWAQSRVDVEQVSLINGHLAVSIGHDDAPGSMHVRDVTLRDTTFTEGALPVFRVYSAVNNHADITLERIDITHNTLASPWRDGVNQQGALSFILEPNFRIGSVDLLIDDCTFDDNRGGLISHLAIKSHPETTVQATIRNSRFWRGGWAPIHGAGDGWETDTFNGAVIGVTQFDPDVTLTLEDVDFGTGDLRNLGRTFDFCEQPRFEGVHSLTISPTGDQDDCP